MEALKTFEVVLESRKLEGHKFLNGFPNSKVKGPLIKVPMHGTSGEQKGCKCGWSEETQPLKQKNRYLWKMLTHWKLCLCQFREKMTRNVWFGRTVAPPWKCTCSLCCGCMWISGYKQNIIPHPSHSQDSVQCYFPPLPKLTIASTGRGFNIIMMHTKSQDTQKSLEQYTLRNALTKVWSLNSICKVQIRLLWQGQHCSEA